MYQEKDLYELSWNDINEMLDKIYEEVTNFEKENNIQIDIICPIVRGGTIPGIILSYKMKLLNICPIQYKYVVENGKQKMQELFTVNPDFAEKFKDKKVNILVIDGNSSTGNTANICISEIRRNFDINKLVLVALTQDYFYRNVLDADYKIVGKYTNENMRLTKEECKANKIEMNRVYTFPWENKKEELAELNIEEYDYRKK